MTRQMVFRILTLIAVLSGRSMAGISVLGGLTHEKTVTPGEGYQGSIVVFNSGERVEEIKVYKTDYLFFRDGTSIYGEPGELPRSNTGWIEFSPSQFRLAPKQKQTVQYRVQVTSDPSLRGTYWSVLMVEPVLNASPENMEEQLGIQTIMRYGIQMITHIGESGDRQIRFVETRLLEEEGKHTLRVDLENTGERFLRPRVWAEFYDGAGRLVGTYEGKQFRTYPGTSVRHAIDVSPVPAGKYTALIVADCGGDDLFGIQYSIQIDR